MASRSRENPFFTRGHKNSNLPGSLTFVGLRVLDPFVAHAMLARNLGAGVIIALGGSVLSPGPSSETGIAIIDSLGLSPYRLALLGMAIGASAKQILWKMFIAQEATTPLASAGICAAQTFGTAVNTLLFLNHATSAAPKLAEDYSAPRWPGLPMIVGSILFATGIVVELLSEVQRKFFKDDVTNNGKPYTGGLFSTARHINYGGYTLWKTGFALASSGWIWGSLTAALSSYVFAYRAIPELDEYCELRYADMWHDYKKQTPYKLLPYIY